MTMRDERTRNLLQAGAFLKELQADTRLPESVRNEARRLLRHYPTAADIQLLEVEKRLFGKLLTPELYPSWLSAHQPGAVKSLKKHSVNADKHRDPLAALRNDFDRLVERMQTPAHQAAVDALFAATGAELGAVAAAHARKGASLQEEKKQKTAAKKRLLDRMVKSTARAGAAIDDAVAYVAASNRKIARVKTKKKNLR